MSRLLFALLLLPLAGFAADPPKDPVPELKRELEELKRQQAALAKQVADAEAKLKAAERRANGAARLTVEGELKRWNGDLYYVELRDGKERVWVMIAHETDAERKSLERLFGKQITASGSLVVGSDQVDGFKEIQVDRLLRMKNFTVEKLPADEPKGKGEK